MVWGGRGRGRFPDPSSRSLAYVVCYLRFRLSVHLSVRPCFCLCACCLSSAGPPVSFVCVRRPRLLLVRPSNPLSLAYVVCYLNFRLSVHLSVRLCFCLCACSPVVGRAASCLRLRPSASPPSNPSIKPSEFSLRGLLLELSLVRPPLCPSVFLSVRLFACRRPDRLFPSSAPVGLASF